MTNNIVNELHYFRNEQVVLYKRGNYWNARLKLVTGKWHRISCKTTDLKDAENFACDFYDDIKFREKHKMALLTKKFVSVANKTIDNLQTHYKSGKLQAELLYKDGKKNGSEKQYSKSGELETELLFKDGKLNGITKGYYKSGFIKRETNFKNDKAISGFLYSEDGKKRKMTNAHLHNINKD